MDGLIALLVIIGIVNALRSNSSKKRRAARRQAQAGQPPQGAPVPRPPRAAARPGRVRTPEELQAHLAAMAAQGRPGPQLAPTPAAAQPNVPPPPAPAQPHGEGRVSTQGESEAEHAEHRRRVAAEEAARRLEREALRDLRESNRDKLRTAVIMSEVLGKPVSLRPRTGYLHR